MFVIGCGIVNTGRTRFKPGLIPWNKGKKINVSPKMRLAFNKRKGISMPKPEGFSLTMRRVNPPIGRKKKYSSKTINNKKLKVWRDGYIMLYLPDWPSSRKKPPDYGYILEHRYVMEKELGRSLNSNEIIHHLDGLKSNNDLTNLVLCQSQKEHNFIHGMMEVFVEKMLRSEKIYFDREKKEFFFTGA